jgi:multiple sugar transport system substrate-binding protein
MSTARRTIQEESDMADDTRSSGELWTPDDGLTRRRFLSRGAAAGGSLLAGSSLLAACGGGASKGGSSGKGQTLEFWQWYSPAKGGDYLVQSQSDWFGKVAQEWNKQGKAQIKLNFIPISQYITGTQLQAGFSARKGPDIFVISPGDFLRYYNAGILYDMTDALGAGKDDFYKSALSTRTVDGRVYGIPMENEPILMYYSVKAFEKAGLSEGDLPKTWDQLLNVAEKLTTGKQFGVIFETTPNVYQNFTWYPFQWQAGADVVDSSGKKSAFNSKGTVDALTLWQETVKRKIAPTTVQGGGEGDLVSNLASGYAAMAEMVTAGSAFLDSGAKDFQYGVFPLPAPTTGADPITIMGGWAWCVNKNGKNPEAAAEFCAWAISGEQSVDRMVDWAFNAKKSLPTRKSVMQKAQDQGLFEKEKILATGAFEVMGLKKDALDSDDTPFARGEPRFTPEVVKAVTDAIQAAQLKGESPAAVAQRTHEQIDSLLSSYNGAPLGS